MARSCCCTRRVHCARPGSRQMVAATAADDVGLYARFKSAVWSGGRCVRLAAVLITPSRQRLPLHHASRKFVGPGTRRGLEECLEQRAFHARVSVGLFSSSQSSGHDGERQTEHDRHPSETPHAPCPFRTRRMVPHAARLFIGRVVAAVSSHNSAPLPTLLHLLSLAMPAVVLMVPWPRSSNNMPSTQCAQSRQSRRRYDSPLLSCSLHALLLISAF